MKKINCFIILFTFFSMAAFAQGKADQKYKKESAEIRSEVWAWDKAQFKVKAVPDSLSKYSKVVVARHVELVGETKSKYVSGFGFGRTRTQTIMEISREMIKLNDKRSVEEYSELSFTKFAKSSYSYSKSSITTYIGIRVIKADGKITEIDADEVVMTKDLSDEKKAKVAISNLQTGDIIDYFIATEQYSNNSFLSTPYSIILFDDAPIMHLSFHAQLGKRFFIEYRSYNGAPPLKVAKNEDKELLVDVYIKNIPPFETSLWVAPAQQLPFIRMSITADGSGEKMVENKITDTYITDYGSYHVSSIKAAPSLKLKSAAEKYAKQMGQDFKNMSDEEKAALMYYAYRFKYLLTFSTANMIRDINIGEMEFDGKMRVLYKALKEADIESRMFISPGRAYFRINEIMSPGELYATIYVPSINKFYYLRNVFNVAFNSPQNFDGSKNSLILDVESNSSKFSNYERPAKVPVSTAAQNAHIEYLTLGLAKDNSNLTVKRKTSLNGYYKEEMQKRIVLYEDFYEYERKLFKEEKSLMETIEDQKAGRKNIDEIKNALDDARKKQKEAFLDEAKDWFEQDVTEIKDQKVEQLGVRHTAPELIYSSNFNLAGLVKKAGNNYIIEIGKIQGEPLAIKDEQRKRDLDIFAPFARSIQYKIELEIPEGFTAEGISNLNKKVENETGSFIVEASATGNKINIHLKKIYATNFETKGNWNKMMAFIDASNEWVNAKILFKKK